MPPKGRTADDYDKLLDREHIYKVPDMYAGSDRKQKKKEWIFDFNLNKMVEVELDLPEVVKRITLEIISNAGDNSYFSRTEKVDPGQIDFSWDDEGYLSIRNGGLPIPVEPYRDTTSDKLVLVPETIFSVTKTSTNYDEAKERVGCGRNGYGSKLTNIFSQHFAVEVGDSGRLDKKGKPIPGQEYVGSWRNNMKDLEYSKATPGFVNEDGNWVKKTDGSYSGEPYVRVSWKLDFDRFKLGRQCYTKEELGLFSRYVIEFSLTCGVPVTINGTLFDYRSIRRFASLFYDEEKLATAVSHFCTSSKRPFPKKFSSLKSEVQREAFIASSEFVPETQILLLDTPNDARVFSYVNGLITKDGGTHVDAMSEALFGPIVKQFNAANKGKFRITKKNVEPHVSAFMICRVVNSTYDSQSKTRLTSTPPRIQFEETHFKTLMGPKWSLNDQLQQLLGEKNSKELSKTDGKKVAHLNIDKQVIDANQAGKAESNRCDLYVVEGKSASSYPKKRIERLPGGKDYNGVYPLQGKPMNVTTHSETQIAAYKEFENIKKMLGLRQGVDYTSEANFKTLRYRRVIITTDADSDGMHILGLIINLFRTFWPSLFDRGFVCQLVTPVVRVFQKGKKVPLRFYDEQTFLDWFRVNGKDFKGDITYYKGLGSSEDQDIEDDMTTAPIMILKHDEDGKFLIDLAFDKTKSDERKQWIQEWRELRDKVEPLVIPKNTLEVERTTGNMMGVSFPPYMIDNLFRSIPAIADGLKKSQRQVLYYALCHYKYGTTYVEGLKKGEKLVAFGSGVVSHSKYHHGDKSLYDTTIKMTRDYCGSNNLPIFRPYGQFGTRDGGGKDAADHRYVALSFPWWYQFVFNKDMVELVPRREVDGELAEPLWIPCDIPLGIINGSQGVATGWSTYIPSHHPIAVVDWILARLKGKLRIDPLVPYFNGFIGDIQIKVKSKKEETESTASNSAESSAKDSTEVDSDEDEPRPEFLKGRGFITRGEYEVTHDYGDCVDLTVIEIPVGVAISDYLKFVKKLFEEGKMKDYRDMSTTEKVHIEMFRLKGTLADYRPLRLEGSFPLTNMVMIDDDGIPHNHDSVENILANYIARMLRMYEIYKNSVIEKKREKINEFQMELRIIIAYLTDKLVIHKKTDDQIDSQLDKLELSKEIFNKINLRGLSQTKVDALKAKIASFEKDLQEFEAKSVQTLWGDRLKTFRKEFVRRKIYPKVFEESYKIEEEPVRKLIGGELSYTRALINYDTTT